MQKPGHSKIKSKLSTMAVFFTCLLVINACKSQQRIPDFDKITSTKWIHSHEEDEGDLEIYRPDSYAFPAARGRRGFEFLPDNKFVNLEIAPADGTLIREGTWTNIGDNVYNISFDDETRDFKIELISLKKKVLKIKIHNK